MHMAVLRYEEMPVDRFRENAERRLGNTEKLMMTVIDFYDGPQTEPDPPHFHPHEQVSYVAAGEIFFFLEDKCDRLGPGDMFLVPPNKPHTIQLLSEHVRLVDCFYPIREEFLE